MLNNLNENVKEMFNIKGLAWPLLAEEASI